MKSIQCSGFLALSTVLLAGLLAPSLYGADDELSAIGQLRTPEYLILIHASGDGTLYTIKTHDGEVIERELPERYLASRYPELVETLQKGIAGGPSDASSRLTLPVRDQSNTVPGEAFP